jgi:cell division protein FtsW
MDKSSLSKAVVVFLASTGILVVFGIAVMTNASIPLSQSNHGESFYYFRHQIIYGFGVGLVAFLVFSRINRKILKKIALPAVLFSILLLILVFVPKVGYGAGGAKRWLDIFGFSFQPSEMAKLAMVIYIAYWLESKKEKLKNSKMILPFLFWLGIVGGLILIEPDFGTFLIICTIAFSMYFSAGAKMKTIIGIALVGFLILGTLIAAEPYRRQRFMSFFNPAQDSMGKGYQQNQALIAIGSGGITGLGLGKGVQKYSYLPETVGDSVFAIVSEELGFFGASLILLIYLTWILSGLKIASGAPKPFEKYLVVGIISWIGTQTFINVLGILGAIPFSGIPLPFISYGGSALMIELAAVGIVINVARNRS